MSNKGKALIFDLDGTLLDSMGVWDEVDADFLHDRGFEVPDDYQAKVAAMQFRAVAEYTINRFGLDETAEAVMDEWHSRAFDKYSTTVVPKPHAVEYLTALRDSGTRLGIATSLPPQLREAAMRHTGIDVFFDAVCSVDDAGDVGKDQPDVYLLAAQQLGVTPTQCTVFEDLLLGMRAAKGVGMRVWAMYDDSSRSNWSAIRDLADASFRDFAEAPTVL